MASEARQLVESVLGGHMTAKVWTGIYAPVLPFNPQGFSVGALLPMVLYLFRWGHRRGRGKFNSVFKTVGGKPTIRSVSEKLAADPRFSEFDSAVGTAVLGDLLLTSILENRRRAESREEQVQRCFATHYLASWIDLPVEAGHLRGVPEAIVALICDQRDGDVLAPERTSGRYPVGVRIEQNDLLSAFAKGVTVEGDARTNVRSDQFDETAEVGLDQLLTVRIAQLCGEAPVKAAGKGDPGPIPNQRPIATRAAAHFREDLLVFLDCYGRESAIPRLSLLPMLESSMAIGLSTIFLSTVDMVESWRNSGTVASRDQQRAWPLFFDCSGSADPALRDFSEQSHSLIRPQIARLSNGMMYMRLLDFFVANESDVPRTSLPAKAPDAADWLTLLGSIAMGTHDESNAADKFFRSKCRALVEAAKDSSATLRTDILSNEDDRRRFGDRLAEVLSMALDEHGGGDKTGNFFAVALMTDEPNGLSKRRRVILRRPTAAGRKTTDVASFVLNNTALEYLVHRHLRKSGKGRKSRGLSYPEFLRLLRERYGFYIDQSPPNMQVPGELLQRNRRILERRLRDLGLLVGVNDAERMKKLRARYACAYDADEEGTP